MTVGRVETLESRTHFSTTISFAGPTVYGSGQPAHHIAFGDFTGDGYLDIAVPNPANNAITVLLNNGHGAFTRGTPVRVDDPIGVITGDFTGDGKTDLVVLSNAVPPHSINLAGSSTQVEALIVFEGNGDGTFTRGPTYRIVQGNGQIVEGDFNNDGLPDIAQCSQHGVSVFLNQGNGGEFAKPLRYRVSPGPINYLTQADLTNNGEEDLIVALPEQKSFRVLMNNGDGTFTVQKSVQLGTEPIWLAVGDFTGNGDQDVAAVDGLYHGGIFVRLGNGDGTFSKAPLEVNQGAFLESITSGDFAGNGLDDLATVDFTDNLRVVPSNGNGTFGTYFNLPGGGPEAYGIYTADLNNDGKPDLVALLKGQIYVYLNTTP